ncbi:MAG: DUF1501 domain-containing protein [Hydrogenophaga sp.]|nr:DUF1501 domain-containing protein [Hydrogenophaga sp.]
MKHLHPIDALTLDRRQWLRWGGATMAGAQGAGSLSALLQNPARAQSNSYRALVCVFLYGGNDGQNMVVPTDQARHTLYAGVRKALALPRGSLIPLDGTELGLHPAMAALAPICTARKVAPVVNVGPLFAPLTKDEYRSLPRTDPRIPDNLFSHSDQQIEWESSSASSLARTGWGGRATDTLATVNPVISVGGNGHFGLSALGTPLVLPGPGGTFGVNNLEGTGASTMARKTALETLYQSANLGSTNVMLGAYAAQQRMAFEMSDRLGAIVKVKPDTATPTTIDAAFAPLIDGSGNITTDLGRQLYQVAKLIQGRSTVQGDQQLFFAQLGGFDTHNGQIAATVDTGEHARLLGTLATAMACFYNAMVAIGMSNNVTLFTQSDFGRTFAPNSSSGTDHAWGNHHLVMGGAVNGGAVYGTYPELVLGGPTDVGKSAWELQGRWLPSTSVDQYAATLLRWFGASDPQLNTILPNLTNFSVRNLGFLT